MINQYIFIVEGVHDLALISKLLIILDYAELKKTKELVSPINKLMLRSIPNTEDRIDCYNEIPYFLKKENDYIAIINANGEQNLLRELDLNLKKLKFKEMQKLTKIIVFCDGDLDNREEKINKITDKKFKNIKNIKMFDVSYIKHGGLKITDIDDFIIPFEVFVFPNNKDLGRLENVLLESIDVVDNELLKSVEIFLNNVPYKYKEKWSIKNSKSDKAKISCLGSVLHPGVGNSFHIKESDWISKKTINKCEYLSYIYNYIKHELEIKNI